MAIERDITKEEIDKLGNITVTGPVDLDSGVVKTTTNQTVGGEKTFTSNTKVTKGAGSSATFDANASDLILDSDQPNRGMSFGVAAGGNGNLFWSMVSTAKAAFVQFISSVMELRLGVNNVNVLRIKENKAQFDKALRFVNLTTAQRDALTGVELGWTIYNTDENEAQTVVNTAPVTWEKMNGVTWRPNSVPLGSVLTAGGSFFINGGAGVYLALDGASDDIVFFNDTLNKAGQIYDGSDLALSLNCRLSSNGSVGDTVGIILDYAFVNSGDNSVTTVTNVPQVDYDVSGEIQDVNFKIQLPDMTGVTGANTIMITFTRNAAGAGSDTYTGALEIVSMEFVKV